MLSLRLLSAAIVISTVLVFVFADAYALFGANAALYLMPVMAFAVLGTAYEFITMLQHRFPIGRKATLASTACAFLIGITPVLYSAFSGKPYPTDCPIGLVGWSNIGVTAGFCLLVFDAFRHYRSTRLDVAPRLAVSFLVVTYCVILSHFLLCIRLSPANYDGLIIMVGFIMTVKMSDAGAYFAGRAFGKRALDPVISPKKTIEGALGGVIVSALMASLFFLYLKSAVFGCGPVAEGKVPFWGPAVAGVIIAITGLVGDLLESVVKRSCEVKDSGSLLPGLGGVWDVTDSLFFAAPFGYLAVLAGWIG